MNIHPVWSQVRDELVWQPRLNDTSKPDFRKSYSRILKAGFKLDLESLAQGDVIVIFTDLSTLTRNIPGGADGLAFDYRDLNGNPQQVFINRRAIHQQMKTYLEPYIDDMVSRIRIRGSVDEYRKKQRKDFQQVLKGKKLGVKWREYRWPINMGKAPNLDPKMSYTVSFVSKRVPYASLEFDSLYSDITSRLPQLDDEACSPFDRFTFHRKYFGWNAEGIKYRRYRPLAGINRKKNFRLYFDKSSSTYDLVEIDNIIKYLNDSNLVIRRAKVLAYASVEGDSAINMRLQEERAMVLMRTLEKANNDSIEISLQTREDWSLFNKQLSKTPFRNRYSKAQWKEQLRNDSIEARFETFLAQQRRAELFLTLTQRLTEEEKIEIAMYDFKRFAERYNPSARHDQHWNQIRAVFAVKKYLEIQAARGEADLEAVCSLFPPNVNEYHIVKFYETAQIIKEDKQPVCTNLEDIIMAAHEAILGLMGQYGENRTYLQQALDVQSFTQEMVALGKLPAGILCRMNYPEEPYYTNLILNQIFFEEHQGKEVLQGDPCLESSVYQESAGTRLLAAADPGSITPPRPKSRYYTLLKEIVMGNNERLKQLILRSDPVIQFDIFEFLFYNVHNWEVWDNQLFDEEVTPEVMSVYLKSLRGMKGLICPNQLNALTITFLLKVMHSSLVNAEATELTTEAMEYISSYYREHADKVNDRLALVVAKQIMAMTPLYYENEPATKAYDVLRLRDWKKPLKGEALNYYLNLVNLVARDRDDRMEMLKNKYPAEVWNSFFSGKYSIASENSP